MLFEANSPSGVRPIGPFYVTILGFKPSWFFGNGSELTHAELANVFDGDGVHLEGRKIRSVGRKYIIAGYHPHSDAPPPPIEHGGIEDIRSTAVVHYFYQGKWLDLEKKD